MSEDYVRHATPVDEDCLAVGFTGEGRCIEPATETGYCTEHSKSGVFRYVESSDDERRERVDAAIAAAEQVDADGVVDVTRAERIAAVIGLAQDDSVVLTAIREEKAEAAQPPMRAVPRVNYTKIPSQQEYSRAHYALGRLHEAGYRDGYRRGYVDGAMSVALRITTLHKIGFWADDYEHEGCTLCLTDGACETLLALTPEEGQ